MRNISFWWDSSLNFILQRVLDPSFPWLELYLLWGQLVFHHSVMKYLSLSHLCRYHYQWNLCIIKKKKEEEEKIRLVRWDLLSLRLFTGVEYTHFHSWQNPISLFMVFVWLASISQAHRHLPSCSFGRPVVLFWPLMVSPAFLGLLAIPLSQGRQLFQVPWVKVF